jgi:hypothetical protein
MDFGFKFPKGDMPNLNPKIVCLTSHNKKERKPFSLQTQKRVWLKAGGHNPDNWRTGFIKTSYCMRCGLKLTWKGGSYNFDHKNNNEADNRESNCYLACRNCHGKVTVVKKKVVRDRYTGWVVGHKTYKKKVGYKKVRRKPKPKKRKRSGAMYFDIMSGTWKKGKPRIF